MTQKEIEVLNNSIKELIKVLSLDKPDYSGIYLIASVIIGGLIAVISQAIINKNINRKDNNQKSIELTSKLIELTSESARLAKLISLYHKELVMHKVHKQYWFRQYTLESTERLKDKWYDFHRSSGVESREIESKLYMAKSEYEKNVTAFRIYKGGDNVIIDNLKLIDEFDPLKSSTFEEIFNQVELPNALRLEEIRVLESYKTCNNHYININKELMKLLTMTQV
jgi:hypothetical protein